MEKPLGLVYLAIYVIVIVALASAVTYGAIRIFPTRTHSKGDDDNGDRPPPADGDTPVGRLFRRAKRGTA